MTAIWRSRFRYALIPVFIVLAVLAALALSRGESPADQRVRLPFDFRETAGTSTDNLVGSLQQKIQDNPKDFDAHIKLANAYLQKVRETGDPTLYTKTEDLLDKAQQAGTPVSGVVRRAGVPGPRPPRLRGGAGVRNAGPGARPRERPLPRHRWRRPDRAGYVRRGDRVLPGDGRPQARLRLFLPRGLRPRALRRPGGRHRGDGVRPASRERDDPKTWPGRTCNWATSGSPRAT